MLVTLLSLALASPSPSVIDATHAEWTLAQQPKQAQAVIDAGVQAAASGFPALIRPFVRMTLSRHAFYCRQLDLAPTIDHWHGRCVDDDKSFQRGWEPHSQQMRGYDGELVTSRISHDAQSITLDFQGGGGGRKVTYRVVGDTLHVTISIYSEQLPKPMAFTLEYTRTP
jgi:hypothetical protein